MPNKFRVLKETDMYSYYVFISPRRRAYSHFYIFFLKQYYRQSMGLQAVERQLQDENVIEELN